jgi:hypothetical protein
MLKTMEIWFLNTQPGHIETRPNHERSHENWPFHQIFPLKIVIFFFFELALKVI